MNALDTSYNTMFGQALHAYIGLPVRGLGPFPFAIFDGGGNHISGPRNKGGLRARQHHAAVLILNGWAETSFASLQEQAVWTLTSEIQSLFRNISVLTSLVRQTPWNLLLEHWRSWASETVPWIRLPAPPSVLPRLNNFPQLLGLGPRRFAPPPVLPRLASVLSFKTHQRWVRLWWWKNHILWYSVSVCLQYLGWCSIKEKSVARSRSTEGAEQAKPCLYLADWDEELWGSLRLCCSIQPQSDNAPTTTQAREVYNALVLFDQLDMELEKG